MLGKRLLETSHPSNIPVPDIFSKLIHGLMSMGLPSINSCCHFIRIGDFLCSVLFAIPQIVKQCSLTCWSTWTCIQSWAMITDDASPHFDSLINGLFMMLLYFPPSTQHRRGVTECFHLWIGTMLHKSQHHFSRSNGLHN